MTIERGKLVPATAHDAERLDTYRSGAMVRVRFVEEKDRWGVRKWWAVINRAVKECKTPWQTASEASEAIKLALGIVNLSKTVGGDWMHYPKSLVELTDPELEEAVEQMLAVLYRVTGVDPDDWRKHIADIGEDETTEPASPSPGNVVEGSGTEAPSDPAAEPSGDKPDAGDGDIEAQADPAASSSSAIHLSEADLAWLKLVAKMLWAATGVGEQDVLRNQFEGAKDKHTPPEISKPARDRGMSIFKKCKSVCFGEADPASVLVEIAAIAGCETREVVS